MRGCISDVPLSSFQSAWREPDRLLSLPEGSLVAEWIAIPLHCHERVPDHLHCRICGLVIQQ